MLRTISLSALALVLASGGLAHAQPAPTTATAPQLIAGPITDDEARALASPLAGGPLWGVVEEVRVGLHAHAAHHALLPVFVHEWDLSRVDDLSFDVLFVSPDIDAFRWIGSPRPEIGTTIDTTGFVERVSTAHAGLTWQLPVFETPFYLEGTFGAAIHDGFLTDADAPPGVRKLGCRVNFYERFGIGANITEDFTALLTYEHMSNADLCSNNDGYSNVGLRLGWKF